MLAVCLYIDSKNHFEPSLEARRYCAVWLRYDNSPDDDDILFCTTLTTSTGHLKCSSQEASRVPHFGRVCLIGHPTNWRSTVERETLENPNEMKHHFGWIRLVSVINNSNKCSLDKFRKTSFVLPNLSVAGENHAAVNSLAGTDMGPRWVVV